MQITCYDPHLHSNRKKSIKCCQWQVTKATLFICPVAAAFGVHTAKTEHQFFSLSN